MKYHQVNKLASSISGGRQECSLQWSFLSDFSFFVFCFLLGGGGGEDNSSNWVFPGGSVPVQKTQVQFLGQEDPLEKEMATSSSVLAWEIPWTWEPASPWGHKESNKT